jgi:hypothetical protein
MQLVSASNGFLPALSASIWICDLYACSTFPATNHLSPLLAKVSWLFAEESSFPHPVIAAVVNANITE